MEPRKLKKVVIKEEIFAITGDTFEAIILNQFIYWQEKVNDFDVFIKEEKKRSELYNIPLIMDKTNGWIYKKTSELKDECMLSVSEQTIRRYIRNLIDKGFLHSRENPKYKWDKTLQYRVDIVHVIKAIKRKGYNGLTGWFDRISIFNDSSDKFGDSSDRNEQSSDRNGEAIPNTTNRDYNIEKEKEDTKVSKKVRVSPTEEEKKAFDDFRKKYPGQKRGLETELSLLIKKHKDWADVIPILSDAVDVENRKRRHAESAKEFFPSPKNLQTYINQRGWEAYVDEINSNYDNEYHPATDGFIRYIETDNRYITFMPIERQTVYDGYTDETRPDNAELYYQDIKYTWIRQDKKWIRRNER